jgi:hypothetical protein
MSVKICTILLMAVVVFGMLLAGCTQPSGTGPVTTAAPVASPSPAEAVTSATTTVPQPIVTVIRYISQTKEIRDPDLLFALRVPVEWDVSTSRLTRTDTPAYRTDLAADSVFSVYSYYYSPDKDRAFRDQFRHWSPAPAETIVEINDVTFDRFESASDGMTRVSYIVRGSSANERGYANVLTFTARDSNQFEKEDFETVVSTFRYFSRRSASTEPGEAIPLFDLSGNALSREPAGGRSLAWGEWEGDSSGGDSSEGDSSGDDSSDDDDSGGGCGCGCVG